MSSGLRLVITWRSTTTSASFQWPPAFSRSDFSDGHEVSSRPLTAPASTSSHGPWQIAASGLPASWKARTKATAAGCMRSWSGLLTPPGRTSAA